MSEQKAASEFQIQVAATSHCEAVPSDTEQIIALLREILAALRVGSTPVA